MVLLVVTDRGGGCPRALQLLEDSWVVLADVCKGHLADLLIEDIAAPFAAHLKNVHLLIIFIHEHDAIWGIFSEYVGVKALCLPGETRFATEVIVVDALLKDKPFVVKLFVEPVVDQWVASQKPTIRGKFRSLKSLVMADSFWHKNKVFSAIESIPVSSLRILDSDKPNLKDAAFAFYRMASEFEDPLTSKLAAIPDYGDIDLQADFGMELFGTLGSFVKAKLAARKADWLSDPVLAAAALNPAYRFCDNENKWAVPNGGGAVRRVFTRLAWSDDDLLNQLLDGWDRYSSADREGVYGEQEARLLAKAAEPVAFFRHVAETSTLESDQAFAHVSLRILSQFANQSASERCNKYISNIHSKTRHHLSLDKGAVMLNVKMHLMYKKAQTTASRREQVSGKSCVAGDLRTLFVEAREGKAEERELKAKLAQLRKDTAAEQEEEGLLVSAARADEVLGPEEGAVPEAPFALPEGYQIAASPTDEELDPWAEASGRLVGMRISYNWPGMGWVLGTIKASNRDRRYTVTGNVVNFVAKFDQDDGATTRLYLTSAEHGETGGEDAWVLLDST